MEIKIIKARLIEDGRAISVPIGICEEGLNLEASSPEAAQQQIEAIRAELLSRVLEKQQDIVKEGAAYTIDFKYTFQE